jgi:hypothetical protein
MPEETNNFSATPEEVDSILSEVTEPEEIRILKTDEERAVAMKIMPFLVAKVNKQLEAKRGKELESLIAQIREDNEKMIQAEVNRIRESTKPPDLKQIEQLLNQEYVEVKFQSFGKDLVIRELPQAAETKFIKIIQVKLMPKMQQFTSIEWTNTDSVAEKVQRAVEVIPDALDAMADIVAIALNPFSKDPDITAEWVRENFSSYRLGMIIQAQVEAGKMRDFILQLFRAVPSRMTA